jgi:predicted ATP-dependent serine protease
MPYYCDLCDYKTPWVQTFWTCDKCNTSRKFLNEEEFQKKKAAQREQQERQQREQAKMEPEPVMGVPVKRMD